MTGPSGPEAQAPTADFSRLSPPAHSRAARLLARLDAGYAAFAERLPARLAALARQAGTFTGDGADRPFTSFSTLNAGLAGTPWLFWPQFEQLDDDAFVRLAEAGALIVLASMVLDHLVDDQLARRAEAVLLHQALMAEGATRFRATLPQAGEFWQHHDRLSAEHLAGLAAEAAARAQPARFDREQFAPMVQGKFAPIVITIAAFAQATGQPGLVAPIEASIKALAVASQLLDDLGDWEQDRAGRRLTYLLAKLAPPAAWQAPEWPAAAELQACIDAAWADVTHLDDVVEWLDRAAAAVAGIDCPAWTEYLAGYRELALAHQRARIARHLARSLRSLLPEGQATQDE